MQVVPLPVQFHALFLSIQIVQQVFAELGGALPDNLGVFLVTVEDAVDYDLLLVIDHGAQVGPSVHGAVFADGSRPVADLVAPNLVPLISSGAGVGVQVIQAVQIARLVQDLRIERALGEVAQFHAHCGLRGVVVVIDVHIDGAGAGHVKNHRQILGTDPSPLVRIGGGVPCQRDRLRVGFVVGQLVASLALGVEIVHIGLSLNRHIACPYTVYGCWRTNGLYGASFQVKQAVMGGIYLTDQLDAVIQESVFTGQILFFRGLRASLSNFVAAIQLIFLGDGD